MPPFRLLNDTTVQEREERIAAAIGKFRQDLANLGKLRILVDGTPGYGHQSSSIFLLRRLTAAPDSSWNGFDFRGTAEVYYFDDDGGETLRKIHNLLPELRGLNAGTLNQASVVLIPDSNKPTTWVKWAFSGGYDFVRFNLSKDYQAANVLVTQPFGYSIKPEIAPEEFRPGNIFWFRFALNGQFIFYNLDKHDYTAPFLIKERAYRLFVDVPTVQDWAYYQSPQIPPLTRRICAALQVLADPATRANIALTLIYGVNYPKDSNFQVPLNERFVLQMAAIRRVLGRDQTVKPPVVLSFGDYNPGNNVALGFDATKALLLGGQTPSEHQTIVAGSVPQATIEQRQAKTAAENIARQRGEGLAFSPELDTQYRFVDYRTGGDLATLLQWLTGAPKRVLFLQMAFTPPPIFNYILSLSELPPIFEGPNTANVALSTAISYFNVNRPSLIGTEVRYPVGYLGNVNLTQPVSMLQTETDQMQVELDDWPTQGQTPVSRLTDLIFSVQNPNGAPRQYFESISAYYRRERNEKFDLAAVLVAPLVQPVPLEITETEMAFAPPNALAVLYAQLKESIAATGSVNLLTTFPDGGINAFYTRLSKPFGGTVIIKPATVEALPNENDIESIVLRGPTDAFGETTQSTITFTAQTGTIESDGRFVYALPWTVEDVPWIVFEQPFMRVMATTDAFPPSSFIGGRVTGTDIDLSMNFPIEEGRIVVRGEFEEAKTLADFFSIVGGVNLASFIPQQILTLGGIGVKYIEFAIDTIAKKMDYVTVRLQTTEPWNFFDRLLLEDITVSISVLAPWDVKARQVAAAIQGTVRIGIDSSAPRISVGAQIPKFVLRGQLVDPEIPLNDALSIFWPGADPQWPGGKEPKITQFAFNYALETKAYQIDLQLLLDWPITISGKTVLVIRTVGLMVQHAALTTTGTLSGSLVFLPDTAAIGLTLAAAYLGNGKGWRFTLEQTSGVFDIAEVLKQYIGWDTTLKIGIDGVGVMVETQTSSFEFKAKTATPWQIPIDTGVAVTGKARIGYNGGPVKPGYYGELSAQIEWRGIALTIFYNFDPTYSSYGIIWGILTGKIEQKVINGQVHQIATLQFTESTTLGSIIETMVSWATGSRFALAAPWSVLNSISISNLSLTYDFTAGKVSFNIDIGPIELGFARIDRIAVSYNSGSAIPAENGVMVTIVGSFRWQADPSKPLGWDATKPETTPAPPGNGNKYLDLRLLALGQHVTIEGLRDAKTVQKAIELMAKLKDPEPGKIPDVTFDPESAWLIGADFGVLKFGPDGTPAPPPAPAQTGYLLTMQVVFNDPYLYGLRLALAGDAAKIFKGLDFQIMYRQVSETVGVYQAEITLPDVMRRLSIGAYSLTLPVFGIAVYTNGDFQVDVGFPWNEDFTRSFTIEGIIYPGIPVLGSAGFYFGKLSSASTDRVPKAINGTFNPVLVFGFGMQIGFGKSIEYGVLKAGFSITAVGIIEGVLAKFNRYLDDGSGGSDSQLQGAYYFWLRGTFGIIGRLYGTVDFAIIKADVNVTLKLLLQLTYESYVSMSISVIVSVDVSVSVKIDLGLFSISISFSFSMRIKETFTIENGGTPPWITSGPGNGGFLAVPEMRVRDFRMPAESFIAAFANPDRWQRLLASPNGVQQLSGWLAPALTVAHDERDATQDPKKQDACYVFMPLIDTVPETGDAVSDEVMATMFKTTADTSFELLAKMILRWAVAAGQSSDLTPEQVDALIVAEADLAFILETVLVSTDADPVPIDPDDVDTFLQRQFELTLSAPPSTKGSANATYFPMPPALRFTVPPYGTAYPGSDYVFGTYNAIDDTTLAKLRQYFDDLAVQVKREMDDSFLAATPDPTSAFSMATWVQSDYFLLLTRQMVQAALDALRDFKYVLAGQTAQAIVNDINTTGQLSGDDAYSLEKLFTANPAHALNAGKNLTVGVTYAVAADDSFAGISVDVFRSEVTPIDLVAANATNGALLRAGATIQYVDQTYVVVAGNTLVDVAWHFDVTFNDFLSGSPGLTTQTDLFNGGASMLVPLVTIQAQTDSTFTSIAALPAYGSAFTASTLAMQNAGSSILRLDEKVTYPSKPDYVIQANDTLADVAAAFDVNLQQLFTNSSVLTQPRLLADVAVIMIPPFAYTTIANDTLQGIATKFATPVQVLGLQPANGNVPDLFSVTGTDGKPSPFLDVPHLVQYRVDAIIAETQRSLAIRQLSRLSARYSMHGLRLPTTGIVPKEKGIWVEGTKPNYSLPPKAGLYALTGQEIKLPVIDATTGDFTMKFTRDRGPSWLKFGSGTNELPFDVKPDSDDAKRIAKVRAAAQAAPLDVALQTLGADVMYESQLASYPLTTVFTWQSPSTVTLPYGPPPSPGQVPALRIWKLPDALINLPDPHTPGKITPRFDPLLATYDEATGGTVKTPITSYGYSTLITFTIKRVPPIATSPSTLTTYEIAGAGGGDVVLLERIVAEVGANDDAFQQLILGYAPDAAGAAPQGVQTGNPAGITMSIAQVNLSTETRPGNGGIGFNLAAEPLGVINPPSEFIRLLWEASITRAGGFYLYYFDSLGDGGLPERIFNDRNEANVSLVVLWAAGTTPATSNRVNDYMNAIVTGDSIDTARSVVFAEAAPIDAPIAATAMLSLDAIAGQTYSNSGDLAQTNASLPLRSGVKVVVGQGVYQAPPGGIALSAIVSRFGLQSIAQLNAANPRWAGGLPDPLPYPVAIYLPRITLTVGTSTNTASLANIAEYYGENLTALAADNGTVAGLFADGQNITVTGGPRARHATVPAGVEGITASRIVPPPVPTNPNDPGYASAFLLNTFSMLNQQVAENVFFRKSDMGLPAGPTVPGANANNNNDKVRVPKTLVAGQDEWEYKLALPYPKFAIVPPKSIAKLPDAADDPYRGVGSILQVDFTWQDYYGNTVVTTLSSPATGGNQPPMVTGYVDPVLALSQWPSIASAWKVAKPAAAAQLEILLTFDPSHYDGLISARAAGPTSVQAVFTNLLDKTSATNPASYFLDGGINITSASLGSDEKTVTLLTDQPLEDRTYLLTATNIQGKRIGDEEPPVYSGTATFANPDNPERQTSSLRENARKDLRVYTNLYYQLNDANGIALTVETSLLTAPVDLDAAQWTSLLAWLFTNDDSIYAFIADREAGETDVTTPPRERTIALPLPAASLNTAQIFELSTTFVIHRTGGAVLENLQTTEGIRFASTLVSAYVQNVDPLETDVTLGLTAFARELETALSVPNKSILKVATGIDRNVVSSVRNGATIWAVRLGIDANKEPIAYSIDNAGNPAIFAPQPISNELQTRNQVAIYDYKTGVGISEEVSRYVDFVDIDMDVWGQQLFASIDEVLTPEFTSPTQIVSARVSPPRDYLQEILDQKKLFAVAASLSMSPVYAGDTTDPTAAQAAFYQELLSRLSNAYTTRAAIQFFATVNASIPEPGSTIPPRLFGNILDDRSTGEPRSEITLTAPKLALKTASAVPLPFLLIAADNVREDGAVVSKIDLDLTYDVTDLEHQIAAVPGIEGYVASTWLSFLIPGETRPLTKDLGTFAVPMILRGFPTSPSMVAQSGDPSKPDSPVLSDVTQWTYSFEYSLPFHYPQDRVYGEVQFNIAETLLAAAAFVDAFPAIAEFITVYPSVQKDLVGILATIDAETDDETQIQNASVALDSFIDLLTRITSILADGPLTVSNLQSAFSGSGTDPYLFFIEEGSVKVDGVDALLVTVVGAPPSGIAAPVVLIEPQIWKATLHQTTPQSFSYVYFDATAKAYLLAQDGQRIPDRTVVLAEMDILQRQDAWSTVYVKRNEELVPGKPTAEPFVYQTPDVQFASPLLPTIDSFIPIDIARIGSPTPVKTWLQNHLTTLFNALFANIDSGPNNEVTIQAETKYSYRVTPSLDPITLPIFLQAPLEVSVTSGGTLPLPQMIANWTAAITLWFDTYTPRSSEGRLEIDLTIMSNLTLQPMPLLRLRDLYLRLVDIVPPLATS